jgi:hypothetical protein
LIEITSLFFRKIYNISNPVKQMFLKVAILIGEESLSWIGRGYLQNLRAGPKTFSSM